MDVSHHVDGDCKKQMKENYMQKKDYLSKLLDRREKPVCPRYMGQQESSKRQAHQCLVGHMKGL